MIYRFCKACRRAAKRFSVEWTEIGDVENDVSKAQAAAIAAAETEAICDTCRRIHNEA